MLAATLDAVPDVRVKHRKRPWCRPANLLADIQSVAWHPTPSGKCLTISHDHRCCRNGVGLADSEPIFALG